MSGRIVFLNGAPSVGKTTLARTIQELSPEPLWHRSLDTFLLGFHTRPTGFFDRILRAYLHSLRALLDHEVDVVAEAVIVPERKEIYRGLFADVPMLLVGVRCPLEIAKAREAARTDRPQLELDTPYWETVHEHDYDLEVDTSDWAPMRSGAERIVERFLEL